MIKNMRTRVNYVICCLFVAGFFVLPFDPPATPMGCESAAGEVCTY
jgi:hypothetical protein